MLNPGCRTTGDTRTRALPRRIAAVPLTVTYTSFSFFAASAWRFFSAA